MKILNWGIVSTGRISEQFTRDMSFVTNARVLGVAARQLDDAQAFAEQHDISRAYEGYQAMFDDPDIDVVYIGTPHTYHFQQARDAMLSGKHVLCEKPLTVSVEEAEELSLLAKSRNLFLMEAMWTYFLPAIKHVKQWLEQEKVGIVKHIKADFGFLMPYDPDTRVYNKALAGGCLLDMGIYPLAITKHCLEASPDEWHVQATFAPNGVENDVIMLTTCGDVRVSLATSFQCQLHNTAYIIGDEGYIEIKDFWRASSCSLYQGGVAVEHFDAPRESIGLNFEAQAVVDAILSGKTEAPEMPHQTSIWLQEQLASIRQKC